MENTRRDRLPMKSCDEKDKVSRRSGPHGRPILPPDEPLCVAERVQTTGFSVTKTRKIFVKKKNSGIDLRPNLDLVGHKMDKNGKRRSRNRGIFCRHEDNFFRHEDKKKTEQIGHYDAPSYKRGRRLGLQGCIQNEYFDTPSKKKTETGRPYLLNSQKATAAAAATLSESTPWCMGMRTV